MHQFLLDYSLFFAKTLTWVAALIAEMERQIDQFNDSVQRLQDQLAASNVTVATSHRMGIEGAALPSHSADGSPLSPSDLRNCTA